MERIVCVVILLIVTAPNVSAQFAEGDSLPCGTAIERSGPPPLPGPPDERWLWVGALPGCGPAAVDVALTFLRHASLADPSGVDRAIDFVTHIGGWRDRRVIAELSTLARAPTTLTAVRDAAILSLGRMVYPTIDYVDALLAMPVSASCGWATRGNHWHRHLFEEALSWQEIAALRTALFAVRDDATLPTRSRRLAHCVGTALHDKIADIEPVPAGRITLTYICGNTFRVRNTWDRTIPVDFDVYGTPERGGTYARPGEDTFFGTERRGTVRIFHRGTLLQTKANGNKPC
jgi:hypothetical protein